MCIWSHISGLTPPYTFHEKLVMFSDRFIFASPISYKADTIRCLPERELNKIKQIWTTGNIDAYSHVKSVPHNGFNIGFVGTLDYSKLHPNFLDFCSKIKIPDVQFIMCGDGCDADKIKQEVKDRGMEDKFVFTGVIEDIKPYLAIIDVFGYPLNPDHFGTCEQVLGEAIAAGIIPIVMKNPAEEYILFQSLVRFVCNDEEEYVKNIELLYRDKDKKAGIVSIIQEHITKLYDSKKMIDSWNEVFTDLMGDEKKSRHWWLYDDNTRKQGSQIFIESLGTYGWMFDMNETREIRKLFASNFQWRSMSKGSPRQYLDAFPNDERLKEWVKLLDEEKV
jgi:glycosyltransferase involved in cell wall biosynthesis